MNRMRKLEPTVVNEQEVIPELGLNSNVYGLPWWLSGKESAYSAGDLGSIPESGSPPGGGSGNSLQYSCLENPMDRGA